MKNKSLIIIALFALCATSLQAQDIVTQNDTNIYMFNPRPTGHDLSKGWWESGPSGLVGGIVQQYVPSDTVTVYGVALTFTNLNGDIFDFDSTYYITAVMMERTPGGEDSSLGSSDWFYRPLQFVDSLPLDYRNIQTIKHCLFQYEFDLPKPETYLVPCHEFYFNTPMQTNRMTDTFYVGIYNGFMGPTYYLQKYSGQYNSSPVVSPFFYTATELPSDFSGSFNPLVMFNTVPFNYTHQWGFAFPIIGFRCKALDEVDHGLLLTDIDGQGVTVTWYTVEEGAEYNVRLVDDNGTVDTVVTTSDSTYRFDNLPLGKRYNVQVRKQCHYATVNYDTVVYSPWTHVNAIFFTAPDTTGSIEDTTSIALAAAEASFSVSPNPARNTAVVTLRLPAGDNATLAVCDINGRELQRHPLTGTRLTLDVAALPAGVYILKLLSPHGVATRRLVVNR